VERVENAVEIPLHGVVTFLYSRVVSTRFGSVPR
jgi:hypothetical protein